MAFVHASTYPYRCEQEENILFLSSLTCLRKGGTISKEIMSALCIRRSESYEPYCGGTDCWIIGERFHSVAREIIGVSMHRCRVVDGRCHRYIGVRLMQGRWG